MSDTVTIPLPAGQLVATVDLPPGSTSAVVFVHGFGSDRRGAKAAAVHEACRQRGWGYAACDFRCHGESSGRMCELRASGLLEDLDAVRAYLADRGVGRLFLVGSSMGGFASSWYALEHPGIVPAVALMAPAFGFLDGRVHGLGEGDLERWRREGTLRVRNAWLDVELGWGLVEERERFTAAELARRWRTPALLFQGMKDDTVSWQDTLALVEQSNFPDLELRLWRDGDHRLLAHAGEMAAEACRFFARWW